MKLKVPPLVPKTEVPISDGLEGASATVPAKSRPGTRGKVVILKDPLELRMSEGRMGEAWILRRSSSALGVGVGREMRLREGDEPSLANWRAFMVLGISGAMLLKSCANVNVHFPKRFWFYISGSEHDKEVLYSFMIEIH